MLSKVSKVARHGFTGEWVRRAGPGIQSAGPWPARVLGGLALLLLGVVVGLVASRYGLLLPIGTLAGLALGAIAFLSPWNGLLLAVILAILLPFGVVPVRLGLTPSFLELTLLGLLAGWVLPPLLRGGRHWRFSALDALAWTFIGLTLLSLLLGLGRGVDATVLHNYGKTVLGLLTFFAVRQVVVQPEQVRKFLGVFLAGAGLAALLGLALWALPDRTAQNILVQLAPVGYPAEGRVLRYVEDDPNGLERAIGTSVDPNSFGGMLALAAAVALGELLAWPRSTPKRRDQGVRGRSNVQRPERLNAKVAEPLDGSGREATVPLPRLLLLSILALLLACLYLTYSRAALGGFLVAAVFLATVRYRRLWWGLLPIGVVLLLILAGLGGSSPVAERFRQGLAFQDLANRMRLAEFANAWAIVQRYPAFGVGFGYAPDVDLSTGVSSLYLTIAERMGGVGLLSFLVFVGAVVARALRRSRGDACAASTDHLLPARLRQAQSDASGHRLALLAGAVAALAVGLLDHYFLNLEFPHMAALLWTVLGLATIDPAPPESFPL